MAHKKSGGSKARQGTNVAGKRLGIKIFGGQVVKVGQIILRQRGSKVLPGLNVKMGKDHTIFSVKEGLVEFSTVRSKGSKKKVSVK